jgi:NodT family efflux transporter outer membrane factor (OMF) lipoprotein
MVDSALTHNFNLKTAWQRLQASRAVVDREASSLLPSVDASASGQMSQYVTQYFQGQDLELGLSSSYEIDLWGRVRSRVEAERFRAKASYTDYKAAAISLSAEIVSTWYQMIEAQNQLDLIKEQLTTNEKVLSLLEARFGSGQIRSADILRQRRLLESTREQEIAAEAAVQLLEHQLAILLGNPPQEEFDRIKDSLPELPAIPETGLPAELIRRRPDVQSAFNMLQAADREVAAAISNQYPRFSISASTSTSADNVENLFRDWAYSLAGNIMAPIFYGGRLRAEVDRAEAVKQQRLYSYGQTILNAFREVEDALLQEKKQREKLQSIKKQLKIARQSYEQLRVEYFNGMGGYLDVLSALDEVQRLQRNLLTANLQMLEYRISLYRSLAGGFETQREIEND